MTVIGRRGVLGLIGAGSVVATATAAHSISITPEEIATDPSPAAFARRLQNACDTLGRTGGRIRLPAGTLPITAPPENAVGPDEGDCIQLTEHHGEITIEGEGLASSIAPVSNRLTLFSLAGAKGLTLRDLHFDNSANGILTRTAKPRLVYEANQGLAGYGNSTNAVVRQFRGSHARFFNVRSTQFHTLCYFRGAGQDDQRVEGHVIADRVEFMGGCQAFLVEQPEIVRLDNLYGEDILQSINADGSNDPGHLLYVTNRPGAKPKLILVDHVTAQRSESSPLKANKGEVVTVGEYAFNDVAGGLSFRRVDRLSIAPGSMRLTEIGGFTNDEGIVINNCGQFSLVGPLIDRREADAVAIRVSGRGRAAARYNKGGVIDGARILSDHRQFASKRPAIAVQGQDRLTIRNPMTILYGKTAPRRPRIRVRESTRVAILDPMDQTLNGPSRGTLVSFDDASAGGLVRYTPSLVENDAPSRVVDDRSGSATIITV